MILSPERNLVPGGISVSRSIERVLGTAYCLDMMYVISDDLGKYDGDNYIRKLDEVVTHEKYEHLPLLRVKNLVHLDREIISKVYISEGDSEDSEYNILSLLNEKLG